MCVLLYIVYTGRCLRASALVSALRPGGGEGGVLGPLGVPGVIGDFVVRFVVVTTGWVGVLVTLVVLVVFVERQTTGVEVPGEGLALCHVRGLVGTHKWDSKLFRDSGLDAHEGVKGVVIVRVDEGIGKDATGAKEAVEVLLAVGRGSGDGSISRFTEEVFVDMWGPWVAWVVDVLFLGV